MNFHVNFCKKNKKDNNKEIFVQMIFNFTSLSTIKSYFFNSLKSPSYFLENV